MPPITRKRSAPPAIEEAEHPVVIDESATSSTNKRKCKCPVDGCGKLFRHAGDLRDHYRRAHSKKKPYECTSPSCGHASADLGSLYSHIRKVHQRQSTSEAKDYVKVRKEILDEEAKELGIKERLTGIVYGEEMSSSDDSDATVPTLPHFATIQRTSTGHFVCPISECDHQAQDVGHLKIYYRIHCGSVYRPFKCIFPADDCRYAAIQKGDVEKHIRVKHFGVPASIKKWKETGNPDGLDESDFIETRTDWLQMEDALFSGAQIVSEAGVPKRSRRKRTAAVFDEDGPNYCEVPFDDDTSEDEDDKDTLAPLLATIQPTTSN